MSDNLNINASVTTDEPEIAADLEQLRFMVLRGKKGDTGDSAYDEAVKLGFVGTEAEWLASLKGDAGAVDSVNGKTGVVELDASDVGALPDDTPIPAAVTEQTVAGWGFTKNTGTYSKPSGGIPATDIADGVIPIVPEKISDLENDTGFETVETYADLLTSTADRVLVNDISDGLFALKGSCMFEKTNLPWHSTYSLVYAHRTTDGAVMVACTDQVPPPPPNFPVLSLGDCIGTYHRNPNLVYGNDYTLFNDSAEAIKDGANAGKFEIDCSSFVDAILGGITYEHSRYVLGTNAENIYGSYVGDNYLNAKTRDINVRTHSLKAIRQAEWFAQQKRLFKLPLDTGDYRDAVNRLRPGDILFCGAPTETGSNPYNPYEIGHVQIVLSVFDDGVVLVAEGGGGSHNLNVTTNDVCRLSTYDLKRQYNRNFKTMRVFARPNYGGLPESVSPVPVASFVPANDGEPILSVARDTLTWSRLATVTLAESLVPGKVYTLTLTGRLPSATPIWLPNSSSNPLAEPLASKESGASIAVSAGTDGQTLITTFGMPFHNELDDTVSIPFIYPLSGSGASSLNIYVGERAVTTGTDADGNPYTSGIGDGEQEYQIKDVKVFRGLGTCVDSGYQTASDVQTAIDAALAAVPYAETEGF